MDLTVARYILVAGYKLEKDGFNPFTAEALVVRAWEDNNKRFGLRGFEEKHPDSNRVLSEIMGQRGLAKRGWLIKVGQKLYQLSKHGTQEAENILKGDASSLPKRRSLAAIRIPRTLEQAIVNRFMTTAFRRYEEGMKREITFRDACRFWELKEHAHGDEVDNVVAMTPAILEGVEEYLVGDRIMLSMGREVSTKELRELLTVHKYLTEQFARNLQQLRNRSWPSTLRS